MKDDYPSQIKLTTKVPRLQEKSFDIRKLTMREFETLMILLMNDGIEQPILKNLLDQEFGYSSQTKGYDHINILCKQKIKTENGKEIENPKWSAKKKKTKENGKNLTRIYVRTSIRKKYEKYILPTISNLDDSLNDIIKEYIEGIKLEEKIRDKFKEYTETIIIALNDLITDTSVKTMNSKKFQRKLYDTIWRYYRAEILKYEVFSR